MRKKVKNRKEVLADRVYGSVEIGQFINYIMWAGKKNTARNIVYGAFDIIKEKEKTDKPTEIFDAAIKNVAPLMEVRSRRIGGANYQVPREVRPERRIALAYRWIINAARSGKGKPMTELLASELILAREKEKR